MAGSLVRGWYMISLKTNAVSARSTGTSQSNSQLVNRNLYNLFLKIFVWYPGAEGQNTCQTNPMRVAAGLGTPSCPILVLFSLPLPIAVDELGMLTTLQ